MDGSKSMRKLEEQAAKEFVRDLLRSAFPYMLSARHNELGKVAANIEALLMESFPAVRLKVSPEVKDAGGMKKGVLVEWQNGPSLEAVAGYCRWFDGAFKEATATWQGCFGSVDVVALKRTYSAQAVWKAVRVVSDEFDLPFVELDGIADEHLNKELMKLPEVVIDGTPTLPKDLIVETLSRMEFGPSGTLEASGDGDAGR